MAMLYIICLRKDYTYFRYEKCKVVTRLVQIPNVAYEMYITIQRQ